MTKLLDRAMILTDVNEAIAAYESAGLVGFDTETSGLNRFADDIQVVSLSAPGLPVAVLHTGGAMPAQLLDFLQRHTLLGHNLTSFDIPFLMKYGYDPATSAGWRDTLIGEQLAIVSDRRGVSKSLKATVNRRLGVELDKEVDHAGWTTDVLTDQQLSYAGSDVQYLHRVYAEQLEKIRENKLEQAWDNEVGAQAATSYMTANGVPVVVSEIREHLREVEEDMSVLLPHLSELAVGDFNPGSSKQVREVFSLVFGLDLESTDVDTLHKLTERGGKVAELAQGIIDYRRLKKASMYNDEWLAENMDTDGRVRSTYKQLGTDTGRYSCSEPNMQQWTRSLRGLIGYEEGSDRRILSVDYSQIEILISAILCKEQRLIDEVLEGDVHSFVASLVFGMPVEQVDSLSRKKGKAAGFTLLFAGGATGIIRSASSGGLFMTPEEARVIRDKFFTSFPKVGQYIAGIRSQVDWRSQRKMALNIRVPQGPLRSLFGQSLTASTVVNTLVQGSAAVGLKRALAKMVSQGLGKYLIGVVHDEVLLDVPEKELVEVQQEVEQCMQTGMQEIIGIRPKTEAKAGLRWSA